jgi:hypothetical protein
MELCLTSLWLPYKLPDDIISKGGDFEFLPVTIEASGMTIAAVLKTGVHCGIEIVPPESLSKLPGSPEIQAGGELALVVQVAEFVTTITYYPHAKDYKLEVVHVYNLVLGVIASASVKANLPLVEVTSQTWGSSSSKLSLKGMTV